MATRPSSPLKSRDPEKSSTKEGREAYKALVKKLASEVKQSATISSETEGETDAICYAVYQHKAYFLNMDTRRARTFDYVLDGKRGSMTLKPCEIRIVDRAASRQ